MLILLLLEVCQVILVVVLLGDLGLLERLRLPSVVEMEVMSTRVSPRTAGGLDLGREGDGELLERAERRRGGDPMVALLRRTRSSCGLVGEERIHQIQRSGNKVHHG